uniref:Uncharacterized protein n=1 Tax=Tanacetum cinerariifolium TaxID=118510 RepID=A0A699TFF5_TANCI|nr:hypothetical protein [Tanacetum cinerariifolium]
MKIGSGKRVKSRLEKDSLGAQEDASKQGRMIEEIDQEDEIALDADTQGRKTDDEIAKGIVFHEQKQSHIPTVSSSKDKVKAKMIEPKVPIKKKDQIRMDEEYSRQLEGEEQKAARLSRAQQDEEANIS